MRSRGKAGKPGTPHGAARACGTRKIANLLFMSWLAAVVAARAGGVSLDFFPARAKQRDAAAWKPGPGTPVAERISGGGLRFPAPFEQDRDRFYWDRPVRLDLSAYTSFQLDISCAHPEAVRTLHLYLRSGEGWYVWRVPLRDNGRQAPILARSDAGIEGRPAGWDQIDLVRLSPWKGGSKNTSLEVHGMTARRDRLALIGVGHLGPDSGHKQTAERVTARLSRWMTDLGLAHLLLEAEEVEGGGLHGMRVAVLGYHAHLPDRTFKAIEDFVKAGGRLVVFYSADERLARLMGLRTGRWKRAERPGQWQAMQWVGPQAWNAPPVVYQNAWNIFPVYPADERGRVVAWWRDAQGERSQDPAWVATPYGLWMTHVLLGDDPHVKRDMLLAVLASLDPDLWQRAAQRAVERGAHIGSFAGLAEAGNAIRRQAREGSAARAVKPLLAAAEEHQSRMLSLYGKGDYQGSVRAGRDLHGALAEAYARAQAPREGEFRGVWDHGGAGWYPGDWERTCRLLAGHGINAIFPNMAWGGTAHYPSEVLPRSTLYEQQGDQIAQAVRGARKHGLEIHLWKICWNLGPAPDTWRQRLEREGRLQQNAEGETLAWLNPADPRNRQLEMQSILEMARLYDVDGIHLDYIRYPGPHADFSPATRGFFERELGRRVNHWPRDVLPGGRDRNAYLAWRTRQITSFVRELRHALRAVKPDLKLSAAVFGAYPSCSETIGQDWGRWLEEDLVDFVCPMNYTEDISAFASLLRPQLALPRAEGRIYPGLGVTSSQSQLTPDQVIRQILLLREQGAAGFVLFDLDPSLRERTLPALSLGVTR